MFAVIGFVTGEAVLCPLETHPTAVIGGSMNDEYLARAKAPWYTAEAGSDLMVDIVTEMAVSGVLDGTVGVFGGSTQEALINDTILPLLEENGVNVADFAITDQAGEVDITASNAQVAVIAERFRGSGVDQVLAIADTSLAWANGVESTDYRPQLFVTDQNSLSAYINDQAGRDLSVVEGSIAGGLYGPAQAIWELPAMQECIKIVEAGGVPGAGARDDPDRRGFGVRCRNDRVHDDRPVRRAGRSRRTRPQLRIARGCRRWPRSTAAEPARAGHVRPAALGRWRSAGVPLHLRSRHEAVHHPR